MLFAIIGGAIAFAWTPVQEATEQLDAVDEPETPKPAGLGGESGAALA
jgi:hypothetical protein